MSRATVHIRERKRKDGKIGIYLEIYDGYSKSAEGKIRPKRKRRTLDYVLYSNPKTPTERSHNKEARRKIEAIKGETLKELLNNRNGFRSDSKSKSNFIEYFEQLTEAKKDSKGNYGNWDSVLKHLKAFAGENIPFSNIDVQFCEDFKEFLKNGVKTSAGKAFSTNTQSSYFCKLRAALNQAVQDDIIIKNPAKRVSLPKVKEHKREYLTQEEVNTLAKTDCRYDVLKKAFLFSCLTGLRWSDIQKLEWNQIRKEENKLKVVFHQQKTDGLQYHSINNHAQRFLPEKVEGNEGVFVGLNYSSYMNVALKQWMMKAGILKNITFHCARHTFATLLLSKGSDLYTVSKLLGHKEIRTTQIYANIIDSKKEEAVDSLNILD